MFVIGLIMICLFIAIVVLIVKSVKKHNRSKSNIEKVIDEEIRKGN